MKKVLVTGVNSYIGTSFKKWLNNFPGKYSLDMISLRDSSWKDMCFSSYDVVFHVVGIAHIRESENNSNLYYKINRDLAFEFAKKAKVDGVKQFIFISSMSVYGLKSGVITKNTPLNPKSSYGKSKLEAERLITTLEDDLFKVVILRPPMIYGKGCKGNYPKLVKLALGLGIFPVFCNKRSMLYIDTLCDIVRSIIDNNYRGLFFPQNKEYVCTTELVKNIVEIHEKKVMLTKIFNPFIKIMKFNIVIKVFGDLVYEKELSIFDETCYFLDFRESLYKTEV